jgi:hypothetical protein
MIFPNNLIISYSSANQHVNLIAEQFFYGFAETLLG